MPAKTTREYLIALRDTIRKEREYAINLNVEGMTEASQDKEKLINILSHLPKLEDADRDIASEIRHENRRNAYLFKTTLGWIRDTMEFFGKRTSTSTYSANAYSVGAQVNGRLLSGRV